MLPYLLEAIENDIVKRGSGFVNSHARIEKLVKSDLPKDRKLSLLRDEYGRGGCTITIALYDEGIQDHNFTGIMYTIYDEEFGNQRVHFNWGQILRLYERRYLN